MVEVEVEVEGSCAWLYNQQAINRVEASISYHQKRERERERELYGR